MWTHAIALATYVVLAVGVFSAGHALLNKRDPRSQLGWVVLCLMLPFFGWFFYWLLGVNRIKTRAQRWQARGRWGSGASAELQLSADPLHGDAMQSLIHLSKAVTDRPLLDGNKITTLHNGEQAFPAMLEAIAQAHKTVHLCTFIFDTDETGRQFVKALGAAAARGVEVRVLVDTVGERYSRPRVTRLLAKEPGVKVARFLPLVFSLRGLRVNLRNHRKLLIVDGEISFTGGMNISGRHLVEAEGNKKPTVDMHFCIEGAGAAFLEESFAADWHFTTGEDTGWDGYVDLPSRGTAICRGIPDGPNEDFEKLQWVLLGALAAARERVCIMTPYFIPSRELSAALSSTAMRGVAVELILPKRSNLPYVDWATNAMLWEVLQHGVRIYHRPPPFAHSKLFMVDDYYVIIGSANLDPRSLRLNFEFNVEIYDTSLGKELAAHFDAVRAKSEQIMLADVDGRSLPVKLRDSFFKIFAPYL